MSEPVTLRQVLGKIPKGWVWPGAVLFFVLIIVVSSSRKPVPVVKIDKKVNSSTPVKRTIQERPGIFLDESVDRKAFVGRLEEQYHNAQEKSHSLEARIDAMDKKFQELLKAQSVAAENARSVELALAQTREKTSAETVNYRLDVVNIAPAAEPAPDGVYLPAGSFVRCTLLTGVYAPVDQNNPLPVLMRLNEAFYGPNETRVPLEGAFVIGKASGDLNSARALVQAVTLSTINPDGSEFHHQGNIGYITDIYGQLGVKGEIVHRVGGQLAASFMTGFLGGASQAAADGETTAVTSPGGRMTRNVTGNALKQASFQGLAQSAAQLSQYYADKAKGIVPAVRVDPGVDVYLVILEGVKINGLDIRQPGADRFWD
jgi:hypothetical protein